MDRRRMCPNCRAFISSSDRVCPYCEAQVGPRAIDIRSAESFGGLLPRAYSTSIIILTSNVVMYLLMVVVSVSHSQGPAGQALGEIWRGFDLRTLELFGAKFGPDIYHGQWWRLVTAGFLHGGLLHIAMNMWVMFELVAEVEQFYGSNRLVIIYVFSSILGFFLSLLWAPFTVSIGASAACFGLIGCMMALGLRRDHPLAQAIRSYYRRWAIYGLIFSFMPFMHIDIAAHVGGLAGGFVAGYVLGLPSLPGTRHERIVQVIAGIALAITAYAFLQDLLFFRAVQTGALG